MDAIGATVIIVVALVLLLIIVFLRYVPLGLWIRALSSGVKIKVGTLVGMRLRRISRSMLILVLLSAFFYAVSIGISLASMR